MSGTYLTSDQQADVDTLGEDARNEYFNLRTVDLDHEEAVEAAVLVWSGKTAAERAVRVQYLHACLVTMSPEEAVASLRSVS